MGVYGRKYPLITVGEDRRSVLMVVGTTEKGNLGWQTGIWWVAREEEGLHKRASVSGLKTLLAHTARATESQGMTTARRPHHILANIISFNNLHDSHHTNEGLCLRKVSDLMTVLSSAGGLNLTLTPQCAISSRCILASWDCSASHPPHHTQTGILIYSRSEK